MLKDNFEVTKVISISFYDNEKLIDIWKFDNTEVTDNKDVYVFAKEHNIPIIHIDKNDNNCKIFRP